MTSTLESIIEAQGCVILDGGLATALEDRGHTLVDALWSARLLADAPEALKALHLDYLRAGADVIGSASYQATHAGLVQAGHSRAEADGLLRRSVTLAREARDEFLSSSHAADRSRPLVAASIGPFGAFLADGSEYSGDYAQQGMNEDSLREFHSPRMDTLLGAAPDLLAFETIPNAAEARALAGLLDEREGVSAWLSLSCPDGRGLADGTSLVELVRELETSPGLVAIGVNCCAPRHVEPLLSELRGATGKLLLAYPNSGETWDAQARAWGGQTDSANFADQAVRWLGAGALAIGGCCRTGPEHVRALREQLLRASS